MRRAFGRLDTASRAGLGGRRPARDAGGVRFVVPVVLALVGVALLVGCGAPQRPRPTTGAIAGMARDRDSGDAIAHADIRVRAHGGATVTTTSSDDGFFDIDHLRPGTYDLVATFAGQPLEVTGIVVRAGIATAVDLVFTLGQPAPIRLDWGDLSRLQIERYHLHDGGALALIEGTVTDAETHERVAGAVVTMLRPDTTAAQQTVSDDRGRFRFAQVPPGTYSVSAYYSVSGRGQIEVLRNGISVAAAEAVVVPLQVEMTR